MVPIGQTQEGLFSSKVFFSLKSWLSRYEGKAFPGLLVCQNGEAALQTAPDRDSGSDRQRIHRGESVDKLL